MEAAGRRTASGPTPVVKVNEGQRRLLMSPVCLAPAAPRRRRLGRAIIHQQGCGTSETGMVQRTTVSSIGRIAAINKDSKPMEAEGRRPEFTPEESWRAIHETMGCVQSSMYVAGTATILVLWGTIMSLGYLAHFAIATLAPSFADSYPWFPGPLWGGLALVGMIGSAIIGHRAGGRAWRARRPVALASGCSSSSSL